MDDHDTKTPIENLPVNMLKRSAPKRTRRRAPHWKRERKICKWCETPFRPKHTSREEYCGHHCSGAAMQYRRALRTGEEKYSKYAPDLEHRKREAKVGMYILRCTECNREYATDCRRKKTCGDECARGRNVRLTSEAHQGEINFGAEVALPVAPKDTEATGSAPDTNMRHAETSGADEIIEMLAELEKKFLSILSAQENDNGKSVQAVRTTTAGWPKIWRVLFSENWVCLRPADFKLLFWLSQECDENGVVSFRQREAVERLGLGVGTISEALRRLQDDGWISCEVGPKGTLVHFVDWQDVGGSHGQDS